MAKRISEMTNQEAAAFIAANLTDLAQNEFDALIFRGAGVATPRGPLDAFTPDQLFVIAASPAFETYSQPSRDWVFNAIWAAYDVANAVQS